MAEFNGIPPVGINSIVRPVPTAPPPAVPVVEAGLKGGGLSGRMASNLTKQMPWRQSAQSEDARTQPKLRDHDPRQHVGPSPAFRASVLELELDLQNTIARVEAARGKRETEIAGVTGVTPGDEAPEPVRETVVSEPPVASAKDSDLVASGDHHPVDAFLFNGSEE